MVTHSFWRRTDHHGSRNSGRRLYSAFMSSSGIHPHGSCKLCTVKVNGRICSACTFPAMEGQDVLNNTKELTDDRQKITQMLFVEGNHFCPSCEKTGNCQLQAVAYHLNMLDNHFPLFYPAGKWTPLMQMSWLIIIAVFLYAMRQGKSAKRW